MESKIKLKQAIKYQEKGYGLSVTSHYDFMAGWDACLENSPLVKSLLEALEFYANYHAHESKRKGFIAPQLDTAKKTLENFRYGTNQNKRTVGERSSNRKTSSRRVGSNLGRAKEERKG